MRSIFSIRFLAAIGAVFALLFGLGVLFDLPFSPRVLIPNSDEEVVTVATVAGGKGPKITRTDEVAVRQIEFVDRIYGPRPGPESKEKSTFAVVDHLADSDVELVIDLNRSLFIKAGTPGEDYCGRLHAVGSQCAVVADLLGEGVVWFALVPVSAVESNEGINVALPAIDVLENRRARLVNGWELPYEKVLTRRCTSDGDPDTPDEFESYREFRELLGDNFQSIYTIRTEGKQSRLTAVECRRKVSWADRSVLDARLRVEYS